MNEYKQTCLVVANISLHAKAKQWKCMTISGYACANYILSALWIIHKCLQVSSKCHYEATWQDFFLPDFSIPTCTGLAGSIKLWKWCQYNFETTAKEHKTLHILYKQWLCRFLFHRTIGFYCSILFLFKIRLSEFDNINLHLYSIRQPIKNIRIHLYSFGLHMPNN